MQIPGTGGRLRIQALHTHKAAAGLRKIIRTFGRVSRDLKQVASYPQDNLMNPGAAHGQETKIKQVPLKSRAELSAVLQYKIYDFESIRATIHIVWAFEYLVSDVEFFRIF